MKTQVKINKTEVKVGSAHANVLLGKTRGYQNFFIKYVLENRDLFIIID